MFHQLRRRCYQKSLAEYCVTTLSNLYAASGVADVTASTAKFGFVHVVIATGNAACRNARPAKAGLKMLNPSPPKISLPIAIEKTAPIAVEDKEKFGGNTNPSKIPVNNCTSVVKGNCFSF